MILPDANVLLYAVNTSLPQNEVAHAALKGAYEKGPVALCRPALLGFLQLSKRAGILPWPLQVQEALEVMRVWLRHTGSVQVQATPWHAPFWLACCSGLDRAGRWCQTRIWLRWPLNTAPC